MQVMTPMAGCVPRAGVWQFCRWLEYDAAEPEGNERKSERTVAGEGMEYL